MSNTQDVIPVKVFVRSRPFNSRENSEHAVPCLTFYKDTNQLVISGKTFAFDSVMDPSTSQKIAFEVTTNSLMEKIMKGFNCTILAYGQTGSGKTYTMGTEETTESMTSESRGIIPRLVEQLFEAIRSSQYPNAYQVFVSMLEIYDEKVNDLLSSAKDLQVREQQGSVVVQGLTRNIVKDLPATMRQLEIGCQLRSKGETAMNAKSSRSHAIFTISVDKTAMDDLDQSFKAKLHLVDLAGSERLKKTQAEGERMKEGIRINEGLLALGNVISALSEPGGSKHIPYRDSKITRLLQDSLGGNSYTVMIACVSPADTNAEETMSTLRYADRAKKIKNKPIVNEDVGQAALLKQLQEKIRQLERQLAERGDNVTCDDDSYKKGLLESVEKENQVLLKRQANLMFVKSTLEDQLTKIIELTKERDNKILAIANKGSEAEQDDNLKNYLKEIEKLISMETSNADTNIDIEMMDVENDDCDEEQQLNTSYVARQSKLEQEMKEVVNQIKSKDQLIEKTKNDLEIIEKHETEKAKLAEKIDSLQVERDRLQKELKKTTTCGKLAEDRRQRVKELEGQINNYKKQLNDYKKLEKQKIECEQKMKKMDDEIQLLKQTRVKLQKAVKEENEKFRLQKLKTDRELIQLKAQERKKELAYGREIQAQQKKLDVMRQKLDESQRTLKKFTVAQAKKSSLNGSEFTPSAVKKFLKQEISHHIAFMEARKSSDSLLTARTSFTNSTTANNRKIEKLKRDVDRGMLDREAAQTEIDVLTKNNDDNAEHVEKLNAMLTNLREKQGEYDEATAAEDRFKSIQTLNHAKSVLNVAFELVCEAVDNYNTQNEKLVEDKKTIQQIKADSSKKERMYQLKLDEFLHRLEKYRERSNTEHSILAGKLANAADEKGFTELANQFHCIRDKLEEEAEELDISIHRASKKPTYFGEVKDSGVVIEATPQQERNKRRSRKTRGKEVDLSPIFDKDVKKGRRSVQMFKEPIARNRDSQENLNATVTIEDHDENMHNATFTASPKRRNDGNEDEAPPLKFLMKLFFIIMKVLRFMTYPFPGWIPQVIIDGYAEKGITSLFEWQFSVLTRKKGSLILCAPTSAGKSIVAELFGLDIALKGRKVLYVLPYIAVAKEKLSFLQKLWRLVDIEVAGFIGPNSAPSRDWVGAVCTFEKANSLISHAILESSLEDYGMVIFDEIHMILDNSRGSTLETLIAKLNYYNTKCADCSKLKIIGMSATLPSIDKISQWLSADIYETDFRPVQLTEMYACDGILYAVGNGKQIRRLDTIFRYPGDIDCTIGFCVESVLQRKPTLVFCSSKNEVEKMALEIAKVMDVELKSRVNDGLLSEEKLLKLKCMLEQCCKQMDPFLAKTLPRGVAFHHAGLTSEERECVEKAYREGTIYALVATSTLSSGVNLPASRVVIKAQIRGPACLNSITYCQMAGRAGRTGFSEQGECIVAIKPSEVDTVLRLLKTKITVGNDTRDASKVILEGVCSGLTPSVSSVLSLTSQLLYAPKYSPEHTITELTSNSLISSIDIDQHKQIEDIFLSATQLGRAALVSSLPPEAALFVFADLKNATKALAIDTELHMMYLVTPINCSVWQGCDWNHFYTLFIKMDINQKRIAKMVGVNEQFLLGRIQGRYIHPSDRDYQLHLRFFSALALFDLISEVPLADVAEKFRICRGSLQALQQQSATYAAMVVAFCNRLGWQYLRSLLDGFASRLAFGVRSELTELIRIEGIDGNRARMFHDHGITSLAQLAQSATREVARVLSFAVPFESSGNDSTKQEWLYGEDKMFLEDAAHTVILRAKKGVEDIMRNFGIKVNFASENVGSDVESQYRQKDTQEITNKEASRCNLQTVVTTNKKSVLTRLLTSTPKNTSNSASPVSRNRPPRLSIPCSQIADDSAVDIFSESMTELSLVDDSQELAAMAIENNGPDLYDDEVDDLETSLLKIAADASILEDSFNYTVELVNRGNTQRTRKHVEDSFDDPLSQLIVPKTEKVLREKDINVQKDMSVINESIDIFDSPTIHSKRSTIRCWSPSSASPLPKSRRSTSLTSNTFFIDDVCRTESTWNSFVAVSSYWLEVAMDLIIKKGSIAAVSLCTAHSNPIFIPIDDDSYAGYSLDEENYPSSTACQNISIQRRIAHIKRILEGCTVYGYNSLNQCALLRSQLDIMIVKPVCVQYLSFLAHYRSGDDPLSLAQLASRFEWPFNIQEHLKMNRRVVNALNSYICSRIWNNLHQQAVSLSSAEAIDLELGSIQVVAHIAAKGFPFRRDACETLMEKIRCKLTMIEENCHKLAGKNFNLESSYAVSQVLFNTLKIPHPGGMINGKRHLSANKTILAQIKDYHPIVQLILEYRQLKHAISQCLKPLKDCVSGDNVIRTSFEICTATGRILSNSPNVQNVSKGEIIESLSLRSIFAANPGRIFVAADYCQLELRILAHLSSDAILLKRLSRTNADLFAELAAEWGFPRDCVKQLCYGLIYGMGVKSLADSTKLSIDEAQRLIDSFFTSFPKVKTFISTTKEHADATGYVSTFLGRRRMVCSRGRQEEKAKEYRQSVNFTIQGTASEIFKSAITKIHRRLEGIDANIVMIVHDEVIIDCDKNLGVSVCDILRQEMEKSFSNLRVPLNVKVTTGSSWAALK